MSSDIIAVTGISAFGHHGVLEHERRDGQRFVVDLEVTTDVTAAAVSDDLEDTVDYSALAREVVEIVEGPACDLIETVAARIADQMLTHEGVQRVRVTLHKPEAPVGVPFADVSVTVVRPR